MAHITGGGLADNLKRALHESVDARIDWSAFQTPPVFTLLQQEAGIAEDEMRRVFNMGVGYTLIVRPSFAQSVAGHLRKLGERPAIIGEITKGNGRVVIEG
jgi:phosphoribosylformylglycinamidine cyclo-ligase